MKTELEKLIDNCTQGFVAWMQQNDMTDVTAIIIYAAFYIGGLYMIGHALTPARSPAPAACPARQPER
ncbi:hypothetical protein [Pantoea sp. PNA 03-3]|uniref:hypothetical protein n=1 Tax=Pantoea TaxID=53335 RepID=UPI000D755A8E|nr:hypothetical protein [Pantoea sp. PNA 03-3]PXV70912.1 hypothetical protein C7433_11454 [Pantoea sp. PNA 03-3]